MNGPAASLRLDVELVRRGLARSRSHACGLVRQGLVQVDGLVVRKPSTLLVPTAVVHVEQGEDISFASRAGGKLAGVLAALDDRGPMIRGAQCVDLGASTGGFTSVLLHYGAAHVVAVDVGHDQLRAELRLDPRVSVREGVNARDLGPADFAPPPQVIVVDLSFISLCTVMPALASLVGAACELLVMVKPQFEVGRKRLGRGGVVRDPALHRESVQQVACAAGEHGLATRAVIPSPLPGPSGNREFFTWLRRESPRQGLTKAVAAAVAWQPTQGVPLVSWTITPDSDLNPERLVATSTEGDS